MKGRLGE